MVLERTSNEHEKPLEQIRENIQKYIESKNPSVEDGRLLEATLKVAEALLNPERGSQGKESQQQTSADGNDVQKLFKELEDAMKLDEKEKGREGGEEKDEKNKDKLTDLEKLLENALKQFDQAEKSGASKEVVELCKAVCEDLSKAIGFELQQDSKSKDMQGRVEEAKLREDVKEIGLTKLEENHAKQNPKIEIDDDMKRTLGLAFKGMKYVGEQEGAGVEGQSNQKGDKQRE